MTLPGSASLGAYQAGACAALAVVFNALRERGRPVHLDAVGGSSAGSIVSMLLVHCLMTGRDAPALLRRGWVEEVDARLLRSGNGSAPLAFDDLRGRLERFLDDDEHPSDVHARLPSPTTMHVGLTSLLGFQMGGDHAHGTAPTLSYADWVIHELTPDGGSSQITEPAGRSLLDAVLVSAAHPMAFLPRVLDRNADRQLYDERSILNLPGDPRLWYSDGGLVESEPVGRIVRAARECAGDSPGERVHLVVDPRSSGPSGDDDWRDPDTERAWLDGVRRAVSVVPTQALHDDVRLTLHTNRRLERRDELLSWLEPMIDDADHDELRNRLDAVGDLAGKEHVEIEMITPLRQAADADDAGVSDLLAGDFIGAFGGFLDRSIRRSDFELGWLTTRDWVRDGLSAHGLDDDVIDQAIDDLDRHPCGRFDHDESTGDGVEQLSWAGRWELALLAAQFGRVVMGAAIPDVPRPLQKLRDRP